MNAYICDCGHPESPHSDITRGYGTDKNGKTACYDCCKEEDLRLMRETGKATMYLVKRDGKFVVANWPGTLEFVTFGMRKSRHNIGRERIDAWFKFDGFWWHAYQIGQFNEVAHCRRTKEKA